MNLGDVLGRALLALVDALGAALVGASIAFFLVPFWFDRRVLAAVIAAGAVFAVALAAAFVLAQRGQRPFPATRLLKGVLNRIPVLPL